MKHHVHCKVIAGFVAILCSAILVGCATCKPGDPGMPRKYDIEVNLDDSLKNSSVVVDLVGINSAGLARWQAYDMEKYWVDGDPMRQDASKVTFDFVTDSTLKRTLSMTNSIWATWQDKGVDHVMVLANLPVTAASLPGNQDVRRQVLSLGVCHWPDKTTQLRVSVKRSGIEVLTPARSSK